MKPEVQVAHEDGFTLIELVVASTLMILVFTIISTGLVSAFGGSRTVNNSVSAQSQADVVFLQLSRQVHTASAVNVSVGGSPYYVALLSTSGQSATCTQFKLDATAKTLSQRSWTVGPVGISPSPVPFTTVYQGVIKQGNHDPFAVTPLADATNANTLMSTLTIYLTFTTGSAAAPHTSDLSTTLLVGNDALGSGDATACNAWSGP